MADEKEMSASEKKKEDWMNSKWRPMMGWMYMAICTADFMLFPILWSFAQTILKQPITQWQPLTLQGAGLFHVAMGAVLGISAMGRTQEKLAGANNGGLPTSTSVTPTPSVSAPSAIPKPVLSTPTPVAAAPVGLDPSDPPTRNTRND
jgi:Holin of 3TMs, for gene-transfer release